MKDGGLVKTSECIVAAILSKGKSDCKVSSSNIFCSEWKASSEKRACMWGAEEPLRWGKQDVRLRVIISSACTDVDTLRGDCLHPA